VANDTNLSLSESNPVEARPPTEMSRAAMQGAAWTALQLWGFNAGSFVVFVVLGRLLTPADFGVVAAAYTVTMLLQVLVDFGFTRYLVQRPTLPLIYADTAFWTAVTVALLFTLIQIIIAPYFALLFGIPSLTIVIRALSPLFILRALDATQSALLDRQMQFRIQAIRRLIATAISAAVAISLAVVGAGVWALVTQQLVLESVTVGLLWRLASWRPRLRASAVCFRELFPFGVRMTGIRTTQFAMTNADNFFVGILFGKVRLGYYTVAYRMFNVLNDLLITVINRVALATFSRLQHDRNLVNAAFYRASRMGSLIALPAYAGLALVARPVVILLFGSRWIPSVPLLQVLMVAAFAQGQLTLCAAYVVAIGGIRNEFRWAMSIAVVQVAAFAIAAQFSVFAVAASVGIVLLGAWVVRLLLLRNLGSIQLRRYFAHYPALLASTLGMVIGVAGVRHVVAGAPRVLALAAEITVGASLLVLALQVLAPHLIAEVKEAVRIVRVADRT
jgi:polysaccharide transporter, PST family